MARVRWLFLKLHLWIGLGAGLIMTFVAVTGAMLSFGEEFDRLMNPAMMTVSPQGPLLSTGQLIDAFEKANPGQRPQGFGLMHSATAAPYAIVRTERVYINPYTGQILGKRDVRAGWLRVVHNLHTSLLQGNVGKQIVGYSAAALLFISVSGIWLWWKRRIFVTRRSSSWLRINFDLHNLTGIYSAAFLIVMCVTGMLMTFGGTLLPVVYMVTGQPTEFERPEGELEKGVPRIPWDRALSIADQALPGAETMFVTGPVGRNAMFTVSKRFPEDRTPGGRSQVFIHSQTGEVLEVLNTRLAKPANAFLNINRPLHTGDIWGLPSRITWFLACIFVLVQAITGFLIWWKRFRTPKTAPVKDRVKQESMA